MKIGPKYKIAKRLGAAIFEKTQTQKFELSSQRGSGRRTTKRPGQASDYKRQLIEKQKMRFSYGITEKQLRRYVDESIAKKGHQPIAILMDRLETRLDNVVYRLGLAKTRQFARQMVSHGHIIVNGKRLNVPSHKVRIGDVITVREGSKASVMYAELAEKHEALSVPAWLSFDAKKLEGTVKGAPIYNPTETLFDPEQVMEFYSR
ncbi:MAG: 30S ribosomal protein S4 [Candidatus Pacebacteria bacterium]|nr:30S ribosomal protein S4 [Candidatus Paceibacterota bacterium]MBP6924520.1 30S ribosomal protein S4 [Candidatus Paceibacterota bacterium]